MLAEWKEQFFCLVTNTLMLKYSCIHALFLDRILTGTGLNIGGHPSNRHRDRFSQIRLLFVRKRDRDETVRLHENVTGSILADRGITGWAQPRP